MLYRIIMEETLSNFMNVGLEAVIMAGEGALKAQKSLVVEFKGEHHERTTNGDMGSERKLVEIIHGAFPGHNLHGEEFGRYVYSPNSPYLWVFDPVDGTRSYINHEPTWAVTLALLKDNETIAAIVYNPSTGEIYKAAKGQRTALKTPLGEYKLPIVTMNNSLKDSTVNYNLSTHFSKDVHRLENMRSAGVIGRVVGLGGSPAYAMALVAKGSHGLFVLGYWDRDPDPWALTAGIFLVNNTPGGEVIGRDGNVADPLTHRDYLFAGLRPLPGEFLALSQKYGFGKGRLKA